MKKCQITTEKRISSMTLRRFTPWSYRPRLTSGYLATHPSDAPTQIPSLRSGTSDTRQALDDIAEDDKNAPISLA